MPPVVALVALAVVFGLAWRRIRRAKPSEEPEGITSRAPAEIFDAVPLVRGEDGVYRPHRTGA